MSSLKLTFAALLLVPAALALPGAPRTREPDFGRWWHDGRAEVSGYRLTVQRYGHPRVGRAAMVVVTEPFSASRHVKLDDPARTPRDVLPVIKLHLTRSFQTGIYDYSTATSLFVRERDLAPVKQAFTSTEWCGQVYEQADFRDGKVAFSVSSYFEGESTNGTLAVPAGGLVEDELFLRLRGLRGVYLEPGRSRTVPFLASPFRRRLAHRRFAWGRATIERLAAPVEVRVPAGAFACDLFVVRPDDGREGRFAIERAHPHRVVRWEWKPTPGAPALGGTDAGELSGSTRLAYWNEHDPGDERELTRLGLEPAVR